MCHDDRKDVSEMGRFDTVSKDALNRVEEIINSTKLNDFLHRKEEEEKREGEERNRDTYVLDREVCMEQRWSFFW